MEGMRSTVSYGMCVFVIGQRYTTAESVQCGGYRLYISAGCERGHALPSETHSRPKHYTAH